MGGALPVPARRPHGVGDHLDDDDEALDGRQKDPLIEAVVRGAEKEVKKHLRSTNAKDTVGLS